MVNVVHAHAVPCNHHAIMQCTYFKMSAKPFLFVLCCYCQHSKKTHKQPLECESISPSPEDWCEPSCQSKSKPLDVVCHFLWAGFATAWGFEECGKNQCEREERKCVFISVGGAWFPLWSVCRPAPGPHRGQQKPQGHCVSHKRSSMMPGQSLFR